MTNPLDLCTSAPMVAIRKTVERVADTTASILLRGESGVGKEIVARAIHLGSPRASTPMHKVNSAALPGELLESELFGHQKGAFTGAYRDKPGRFELAHRGTLFLDEIGELPLGLQAKLLHVLQDGEFARVGDDRVRHADVRVIAATNADLEAGMRTGRFREDLYYRLNVIEIRIPPLRERREEIPGLVSYLMAKLATEYGREIQIAPSTLRAMTEYAWPGNVRELENVLRRALVLGRPGEIEEAMTSNGAPVPVAAGATRSGLPVSSVPGELNLKAIARTAARDAERIAIRDMLERVHWNRSKAARLLQVSYKALLYKIVECGLSRTEVAEAPVEVPAA